MKNVDDAGAEAAHERRQRREVEERGLQKQRQAHGQRHGQTAFVVAADTPEADEDFDQSGRHLSKAERKRLKKLARMSRAA